MLSPARCALTAFILWSLLPAYASSEKLVIDSDEQFRFAERYLRQGEYSKAVVELERFIYFFPESERVPEARYLAAEAYLRNREYEKAREALAGIYREYPGTVLAGKALLLIGESYYLQGAPAEAEQYYRRLLEEYPATELENAALFRLGWSELRQEHWKEASAFFGAIRKGSPLYPSAARLSEKSLEGADLPYKNPTAAGVLAGALPGLGHAYCERYKDGVVALLLNGLFIWAAVESFDENHDVLGGILLFLEAGWYSGNIYSAVNCAQKHNRRLRQDFFKTLPENLHLDIVSSGRDGIGLALRFEF